MHKLIREPLLHFLLIGAGLFLLFNVVSGKKGGDDKRIVVSQATVDELSRRYLKSWQRTPQPAELKALIDSYVRDELLYREGLALGLDRDDSVVRQRVLQKVSVIAEESATHAAPTDAELAAFIKAHADRYSHPAVLSFEQVFFDPMKHGSRLDADLADARKRLAAGADAASLGDATMLPASVADIRADRLAQDFGDEFGKAMGAAPVGEWHGPVGSGYGQHLVRVSRRTPGRVATLPEVRDAVLRDWEVERRTQAAEAYVNKLMKSYDVVIDAKVTQ